MTNAIGNAPGEISCQRALRLSFEFSEITKRGDVGAINQLASSLPGYPDNFSAEAIKILTGALGRAGYEIPNTIHFPATVRTLLEIAKKGGCRKNMLEDGIFLAMTTVFIDPDMVLLFLEAGKEEGRRKNMLLCQNKYGDTALILTAWLGHSKGLSDLLIAGQEEGCRKNMLLAENKDGRTAMEWALHSGRIDCVRDLLAAGREEGYQKKLASTRHKGGWTDARLASYGRTEIARMLREAEGTRIRGGGTTTEERTNPIVVAPRGLDF